VVGVGVGVTGGEVTVSVTGEEVVEVWEVRSAVNE